MFDNRVSAHIPNNLPSFVKEDYTKFVEFVQDCYRADERRGSSLDILRNVLSYKNFGQFDTLSSSLTTLLVSIDDNDTQIELADASGFPTNNGVIRIEDEIILYKTRSGDTLEDCLRGSSYTTSLNDAFETQTYTYSDSVSHDSGVVVEDLTTLALSETLKQTHSTFLPSLSDEVIDESVRRSTILSRISSFYRSKGSSDGIRILFRLLYGNAAVDVRYPGEQVLKPSDSTWTRRDIIKCELVSGDISIVDDNTLYQLTDSYDSNLTSASVIVEDVKKVSVEGQYIYEISINPNNRIGTVRPAPRTILSRSVQVNDSVITVESTYGFPQRNGRFYIGSELINYAYRTSNQFHECTRNTPVVHTLGDNVYGVGFLYAYSDESTTILRVLGVVNQVDVKDGGLFHVSGSVEFDGTGRTAPGQPIIEEWIENTNYDLASVFDSSIYDVSKFTSGINSIHFDERNVFVQSSSLPPSQIGPLGSAGALELRPLSSYCVFPRDTKYTTDNISTGNESVGMFVDGVLVQSCRVNEQIISGQITSIDVVSSGVGYNTPPTVIVSGGGGSGVVATANLNNGRVTTVTVTNGGSGFTSIPSVRFSSGEGASISPTFDSYGRLVSVSVLSGGNYYTDVPEVVLVDPTGRGRGSLLAIDPTLIAGGVIQSNAVRIVNRGIDYSPSSYVIVRPTGSGATATASVYTYDKDSYTYVTSNPDYQLDAAGGFVYPRQVGSASVRNTYCYGTNPITLRTTLGDTGVSHSPILGFAFDGNPIYGPYGYTDPADSDSAVIRMTSSYQIGSRSGVTPPSVITYPLGTFVQDYVYVQGLGTLDEHNGRFCVTPEYPDGTYAYFVTVDGSDVPQFPYIIGPAFYALPSSQDVKFLNEEQFSDTSKLNVISQNFYGEITLPDYDYSKVIRHRNANLDVLNESLTASIASTSTGSINGVYVDYSDDNYAVGDFCRFDYTNNQGGGCEARVSWVVGEDITTLSMAVPNVQVFLHDQEIDLSTPGTKSFAWDDISTIENAIYFDSDHDFVDGMRVLFENTSGDLPNGLLDGKAYFVKVVDTTTIRLAESLRNLQNNIMVTISSQGTGNKSLTPIYSIARNRVFTTEGGSEFIVTGWNPSTKLLSIRVLNQIRVVSGDTFRDMIGSTVYAPTGSVTEQVIDDSQNEIPVNNSAGFSGGDIIQVGVELMSVVEVLANDVLLVKRADTSHPDIPNDAYVVNLSRLAIIVNTSSSHDLSLGDTIEIIGASPEFFNGTVVVDDIIDTQTVVCLKRLSELDSDYVFDEASSPEGLAFVTTTQPYFVTNLETGTLWWSSLTGALHIYYQDNDSGQWVSAIPTGVMPNMIGDLTDPVVVSGEPSSSGNTISGGVIQICEVAPSTRIDSSALKEGDFWWSSLTGYLYIFFDGLWVPATPTGVAPRESESAVAPSIGYSAGSSTQRDAVVTVSENPPTDGIDPVQDGDLWWSSLSGFLYIRYNDQWVIATPIGVWPGEGVSQVSVSTSVGLNIDYLIVLVATGDYFFVTSSLSVVGPIYRVQVTVTGSGLSILPDIVGVYPRILDRSQLSVNVNVDGTIDSVDVLSGGSRYKNPSILFISSSGSGATGTVTLSGGSVVSVDIVDSGSGYLEGDVEALIVETGNILVPTTNNIGSIQNISIDSVGYYQNVDPTLVPSVVTSLTCTLIDVTGVFVVGSAISTSSGTFSGIVAEWDSGKRMMTITDVDGVLMDGELISTMTASGFVLQSGQSDLYCRTGSIGVLSGNFLTSKSILSSSYQKLLDSYYYQDFSYVIDSEIQLDNYRQLVLDNVHPAGYALFGQLSLTNDVVAIQTVIDSEITTTINT